MGQLTKEIVIDKMEILEDGQIQVRTATRILENGVILSQSYHRHVIEPDSDITKEDKRVKDVHAVICTQDVKDAYVAKKAAMIAEREARMAAVATQQEGGGE